MGACKVTEYIRREPEKNTLYKAIEDHLDSFIAARAYEGQDLPEYIIKEFREYLRCGRLEHGMVIVACGDCGDHYPVALSCKKRGFCSSCCGKRMNEAAMHLIDNVLPYAPYRQFVVTVPPALRYWMGTNRKLARKVHKIAISEIDRHYNQVATSKLGITSPHPAAISFTQLCGSALNYNYHWHILYLDGVYSGDDHPKLSHITNLANEDVQSILEKIVSRTIRLCKRHKLLNEDPQVVPVVELDPLFEENTVLSTAMSASITNKIAFGERAGLSVRKIGKSFGLEGEGAIAKGRFCYSQNGFSIHAATAVGEYERKRLEQLIRYISRPPVANSRLKKRSDGTFTYKLKTPWDNGKITHVLFSGEELLEKLTAIIPTPRAHLSKNCGVFSSHHRMRPKIILMPEIKKGFYKDEDSGEPKRVCRSKLFSRTFKIDLTICRSCGGNNLRVTKAIFSPSSIARYLQEHVGGHDPPQTAPLNLLKFEGGI
jgi:hypothetical protein